MQRSTCVQYGAWQQNLFSVVLCLPSSLHAEFLNLLSISNHSSRDNRDELFGFQKKKSFKSGGLNGRGEKNKIGDESEVSRLVGKNRYAEIEKKD